jgi:acyl-coenzyme A synthetase/AMP-(fatty) acid ligase
MKTQQPNQISLWNALTALGDLSGRSMSGASACFGVPDMVAGSVLGGRGQEFYGRSVLVATTEQLTAIATLIELDGLASRIVLYPPDLPLEHLSFVAKIAGADAIVSDRLETESDVPLFVPSGGLVPCVHDRSAQLQTEWVLLTSGTTGNPKLVVHTLASLTGAIEHGKPAASGITWSTFYDIRRYGGLQIFLRAALTGTSLVLSSAHEPTAQFLGRAGARGVTHISGTPSHWRRALMSPSAHRMAPDYIRLSGEIADQALLDQLRAFYPQAGISHAFASTEAGVAFNIKDVLSGLHPDVINHTPGVEMKIEYGTLRIRSDRTASRYLNHECRPLKDKDGFVDTGDVLELRGDRYYFVGRRDGVINVGGLKVHPEEVEEVINRHPHVRMSLVRTRKNPIIGSLVIADVVLETAQQSALMDDHTIQRDILTLCRESLSAHKVPVSINFVPTLAVAETGKLIRCHA